MKNLLKGRGTQLFSAGLICFVSAAIVQFLPHDAWTPWVWWINMVVGWVFNTLGFIELSRLIRSNRKMKRENDIKEKALLEKWEFDDPFN